MDRFKVNVKMNNAAFKDEPMTEVCRILRDIASRIEAGEIDGSIRDINGNRVGFFVAD